MTTPGTTLLGPLKHEKECYYVLGAVNSAAPSAKIFAVVEITLG